MRRFINFLFIAGAVAGVFYLIGLIAPRASSVQAIARMDAYPRDVGKVLADFATWPSWHPTIQSTRGRDPTKEGDPVWAVQDGTFGPYEVRINTCEDNRWTGTWDIEDERFTLRFEMRGYGEDRSQVSVTCQRIVADPWKRAARLLWGKRIPVADMLKGLGKKLRSEVEFE